tara:strand:- start:766 stop:1959 length:1194 start_codon:yes stop_codon:yes gene_type:complete
MTQIQNLMENSKSNMMNMLKNRKFYLTIFLFLVILLIVFALAYHLNTTLGKKEANNQAMIKKYQEIGGSEIGGITSSNANHKHLLRDYYVMSSHNSCCGGNFEKDFVDLVPLNETIKRGARFLDFEIYSLDGEPVVAAGKEASENGKYLLKGTYNSLPFSKVMMQIKMMAFSGSIAPNSNDPLFLSFRIKSANRNIFRNMAKVMNKAFTGMFLPQKYGYDGKFNKEGKDIIANIPLLELRNKVIVIIEDPLNNYRGTPFEALVNMSGKAKDGSGMPFVNIHKNREVTQVYDKKSMINENKKFIGITRPDFTNVKTNPSAAIHHQLGNQMVMMNFSEIDAFLMQYIKFFSDVGSAFRLKPDHLRYFEKKIPAPPPQEKKLSYAPRKMSALGGVYTPQL